MYYLNHKRTRSCLSSSYVLGGRGNGGSGGGGGNGGAGGGSFGWSKEGSGDDGEGDHDIELPRDVTELLAKAGRKFTDLPASTQKALVGGSMTSALLQRYLELEKKGGVVASLLGMGIFRDRLLMDGYLMDKMGIEMAVGSTCMGERGGGRVGWGFLGFWFLMDTFAIFALGYVYRTIDFCA